MIVPDKQFHCPVLAMDRRYFAYLLSRPCGSLPRLSRPACRLMPSIRQEGSISCRLRERTPASRQSENPTRRTSGADRKTSHRRRNPDAEPNQLALIGSGSSRHYLALYTSHRAASPHPHHSGKTMVVPVVQGALYFY